MASRMVARTEISDLNDSGTAEHALLAAAHEVDGAYYQLAGVQASFNLDEAEGDDLDERAREIQPGTIRRRGATRALGFLTFSREVATGSPVPIPKGTIVSRDDGVTYKTTAVGEISAGDTASDPIPAVAVDPGSAGNAAIGSVILLETSIAGCNAVTNSSSFVQGRDKETDAAFRARIKLFVASLAARTVDALRYAAIGVEDPATGKVVMFARVYEDIQDRGNVTVYIDDGAGTALETATIAAPEGLIAAALGGETRFRLANKPVYYVTVGAVTLKKSNPAIDYGGGVGVAVTLTEKVDYFLNPASGQIELVTPLVVDDALEATTYDYYTGLVALVQKMIDGDPADRESFPGVRAEGIRVLVKVPAIRYIVVEGVLSISGGTRSDVSSAAETAVSDYINTIFDDEESTSNDVIFNEIVQRIMEVPYVTDVSLSLPTGNIVIDNDEIPRIQVSDIDLS